MKPKLKNLILLSLLCCFKLSLFYAQNPIQLLNPSFEDEAADATVPRNWIACDPNTTPDILPGFWGVYLEPSDGETYVGLITRSDGSSERIGQRFSQPLSSGNCYRFSMDICRSENYTGYNQTIQIRLWVGNSICAKDQMIYLSDPIKNNEWKTLHIEFNAKNNASHFRIEAYTNDSNHPKGNILIDNLTAFHSCHRT